jgi:hypothetical protein
VWLPRLLSLVVRRQGTQMVRSERFTVSRDGKERAYTVWLIDDPPDRQEAVTFFQLNSTTFIPEIRLPPSIESMSIDQANELLRHHPIQKEWVLLRVGHADPIRDNDLRRLRFVPELRNVRISAPISDEGVRHLLLLPTLETLVLYSDRVTDECLESIRRMQSLRQVDFQCSNGVSRAAFEEAIQSLDPVPESWPPS